MIKEQKEKCAVMMTLPAKSLALPITHPPVPLTPLPLPSPMTEYLAWFDGACEHL